MEEVKLVTELVYHRVMSADRILRVEMTRQRVATWWSEIFRVCTDLLFGNHVQHPRRRRLNQSDAVSTSGNGQVVGRLRQREKAGSSRRRHRLFVVGEDRTVRRRAGGQLRTWQLVRTCRRRRRRRRGFRNRAYRTASLAGDHRRSELAAGRQLVDEHMPMRWCRRPAGSLAWFGAGVHEWFRTPTTGQRQRLRQREHVRLVDEATVVGGHRTPSHVARPGLPASTRKRQLRRTVLVVDADFRRWTVISASEVGLQARPRRRSCVKTHLIIGMCPTASVYRSATQMPVRLLHWSNESKWRLFSERVALYSL